MAQRNRLTLKSYFEKGDKPTQSQFADLIDSIFVLSEDNYLINSIEEYKSVKTYVVGNLAIYQNAIWVCKIGPSTGSFQLDNWNRLPGNIFRYAGAIPVWTNSNGYAVGNLVISNGLAYRCTSAHTSSTSNLPPNNAFWQRVETFDGITQNWKAGVYLQGDTVFFGNNCYRCVSTVLFSSNFGGELVANNWKLLSQIDPWVQNTNYLIGEWVYIGTTFYRALLNHTSSTNFTTDLNNGNWQSFAAAGSTANTQTFIVNSNFSPWVFTLNTPYPNSLIGLFMNGRLRTINTDFTQTGSNNEIFTWISAEHGLEIGDEIQIKYL